MSDKEVIDTTIAAMKDADVIPNVVVQSGSNLIPITKDIVLFVVDKLRQRPRLSDLQIARLVKQAAMEAPGDDALGISSSQVAMIRASHDVRVAAIEAANVVVEPVVLEIE